MSNVKSTILKNLGLSYLKRILKVIDGPTFVSIFFTRNCNYNCSYCATSKGAQQADIGINQWKNIVTQIYNQGCRFITIYGGEPTLRSDLGELLKHCINLGIFTHLVTNGSLLNREILEEYALYGYLLLGLSIDSLNDTFYSLKKYNPDLINLLCEIREKYPENIDYSVHIINTRENVKDLIPLIKEISKKLECRFSIDPVHSAMRKEEEFCYRSYCPDLLLHKKTMNWLVRVIINLKKQGIQFMSPNIYYYYMNKWYNKKYFWKCDAGDFYYSVDNDGTVMLCEDVKTNIKFDDFIKLSHGKRVKKIQEYKFDYCDCFKPCYWNPTNFIRNPIKNFIFKYKIK
ncbi:MAG: radical SAM protein [Promethearchaeota archaeon]